MLILSYTLVAILRQIDILSLLCLHEASQVVTMQWEGYKQVFYFTLQIGFTDKVSLTVVNQGGTMVSFVPQKPDIP